jgi:hypothetical protein
MTFATRPVHPDELRDFAPRPPSEVEWEDLLIRLEIVPRIVRNEIEEADPARSEVVGVLRGLVDRERWVGQWLEALAATAVGAGSHRSSEEASGEDAEWLAHRFASLRARTFVMVQRRGLDVWEWAGEVEPGQPATVYQLLCWLAALDGEALLGLRAAVRC